MRANNSPHVNNQEPKSFTVWACSDPHVVREELVDSFDTNAVSRESMRVAVEQADGPEGFHYDIGVNLGDLLDFDYETVESFQKYLNQLGHCSKDKHYWYHVGGNNDENSVLNDPVSIDNEFYRKYIDPVGEFTEISGIENSRRPYPVTGTYERYLFDVGNIRFLCLSDRNDLPAPYGRGEGGYYVDGAITLETYQWLVDNIIKNPDRIIVIFCHHPLKDTTIGTTIDDSWQGKFMTSYNEKFINNPEMRLQSVLHQVYDVDPFDSPKFRNLLGQNTGIVDLWISGHVHHLVEQNFRRKGKYASAFGGHHFNAGTICRYRHPYNLISAQSTLFTFNAGSDVFESKVYVHDHPSIPSGFYGPENRSLKLKKSFQTDFSLENVVPPSQNIAGLSAQKKNGKNIIKWEKTGTGTLIVKEPKGKSSFTPEDGQTYYSGQKIDDTVVVFMGTNDYFPEIGENQTAFDYRAFAYNAGGGKIYYVSQ